MHKGAEVSKIVPNYIAKYDISFSIAFGTGVILSIPTNIEQQLFSSFLSFVLCNDTSVGLNFFSRLRFLYWSSQREKVKTKKTEKVFFV
jgi:hypothetical protein